MNKLSKLQKTILLFMLESRYATINQDTLFFLIYGKLRYSSKPYKTAQSSLSRTLKRLRKRFLVTAFRRYSGSSRGIITDYVFTNKGKQVAFNLKHNELIKQGINFTFFPLLNFELEMPVNSSTADILKVINFEKSCGGDKFKKANGHILSCLLKNKTNG